MSLEYNLIKNFEFIELKIVTNTCILYSYIMYSLKSKTLSMVKKQHVYL